jgi:response regulator of citrate/malate metabolism
MGNRLPSNNFFQTGIVKYFLKIIQLQRILTILSNWPTEYQVFKREYTVQF